jgi:pimeloyl-ACP methyl ester carboxylesterase
LSSYSLSPVSAFCKSILIFLVTFCGGIAADGLRLESFAYPFPVQLFELSRQQQELEMAYMDVQPNRAALGTVVLLHGKNFSGAYWKETAEALRDAGFRVIMPDQVGFGKSSKPEHLQFSFHQLATDTHELLRKLGVERPHILGHSMGGMLAARYALMFPEAVQSLTLLNPLGLEDWKAKGVPYRTIDALYQQELTQTAEKIRAYQRENYYGGSWQPAYERWVEMLVTFTRSPGYPRMARVQALTSDMIYTQPVYYEFPAIKVPTLLIIGERDRTAPGKDRAPESARGQLGNYPELGRAAAKAIPGARLVALPGIGHAPHLENFAAFITPLREFLTSAGTRTK